MSIVGLAACKARLTQLIADAEAAVRQAQGPAAVAAEANRFADALVDFTAESRPAGPEEDDAIKALDALAIKASNDLAVIAIGSPVGAIAARVAELAALIAKLDHDALANVASAQKLRLQPVRDAIDGIADAVASAKALAKTLDATRPEEASIIAAIAEVSAKYTQVRAALDRLAG